MRSRTGTRRIVMLGLAITGTVLLVLGAQAPTETPAPTPEPGIQTEVPAEIPQSARAMRNPTGGSPESVDAGKQIYSSQCGMCHGTTGDGTGDLAVQLKYRMPDLSSAEVQRARTDGEWFYILTEGHGKMMGQAKRLNEAMRWELVSYMRTLGPR